MSEEDVLKIADMVKNGTASEEDRDLLIHTINNNLEEFVVLLRNLREEVTQSS